MGKARHSTKLVERLPGYDGAVEVEADVRLSQTRHERRSIRCRPGTFEWRYGRETGDGALYHAGNHFAILWEKAGTAAASSPDLGSIGGGAWKGLPDGRAVAMDEIGRAMKELGKLPSSRLSAYCVDGLSVSDLALRYGVPCRDMSAVLHLDLHACALHFDYL